MRKFFKIIKNFWNIRQQVCKSAKLYQNVVENSPNIIFTVDLDGKIVLCNETFKKILNIDPFKKAVFLKDILYNQKEIEKVNKYLHSMERGDTYFPVLLFKNPLDGYFEMQSRIYPLLNYKEEIEGAAFSNSDITSLREKESISRINELKYKSIFQNSPLAIVLFDKSGKLVEVNSRMEEWIGYKKEEVTGKNFLQLPFINPRELSRNIAGNKKGEVSTFDLTFTAKTGEKKFGRVNVANILDNDGKIDFSYIMISNITEFKKMEDTIAENEKWLQTILETLPVGISIIDKNTKEIIYSNPSVSKILGFDKKDIQGKKCIDILCPNNYDCPDMKDPGKNHVFETNIINKSGKTVGILKTLLSVEFKDQNYLLEVLIDITQRKKAEKQLQEAQNKFKITFDYAPALFFIGDLTGNIMDVNIFAEKMLGLKKEEIIGQNIFSMAMINEEEQKKLLNVLRMNNVNEATGPEEFTLLTKDSRKIPVSVTTYPIEINNEKLVLGIAQDISRQKTYEQKLKQMNDEISGALAKEKELSDLKSRFISTVSHEFRTPLTVIMNSAGIIEMVAQRAGMVQHEKYINHIKTSIDQMTHLLNNVIHIQKAETGNNEVKPVKFDVIKTTLSIIDEMKMMDKARHQFKLRLCSRSLIIYSDQQHFYLVLNNLVSNAIKYSPDGETIEIMVEEEENNILVTVADKGIGIPKADQKHLFEPFFRSENSKTIEGTGLGLSIVKTSLDNINGKVKLISGENQGAKFIVEIPKEYKENLAITEKDFLKDVAF